MSRVGLLMFEGVDDLDLVGSKSVFDKATTSTANPKVDIVLLSATHVLQARTAGGLLVDCLDDYRAIGQCDALVVPGGRAAEVFKPAPPFREALRVAASKSLTIYSICSGAFILAACGMLAGRRVAVHSGKCAALAAAGDCEAMTGLIHDGGIWSIGGAQPFGYPKSIAMAMLVLKHFDAEAIEPVRRRLELEAMDFGRRPSRARRPMLRAGRCLGDFGPVSE
jgi:transcriptional regulator GlxA family with amidase domain